MIRKEEYKKYLQTDIDFFENEIKIFNRLIAKYSFTDPKMCRNMNRLISSLNTILDKCKVELKERVYEHKTDFPELFGNREDAVSEEEHPRDTNPVHAEPERQTSWFAER